MFTYFKFVENILVGVKYGKGILEKLEGVGCMCSELCEVRKFQDSSCDYQHLTDYVSTKFKPQATSSLPWDSAGK
jgi:hypothetical protein